MKVVICNNRYFRSSGPETYLFGLKEWLERAGHDVHPFSVRLPENEPAPDDDLFVESFGGQGKYLYRDYVNRLNPVQKVRVGLGAVYSLDAQSKFARLLDRVEPDVVYTLNITNMITPSVIYEAHRRGVPVVARCSDYSLSCPAYGYFRDGQPCFECRASLLAGLRHRCVQDSLSATAVRVAAIGIHRALGLTRRVSAFVAPSRFMADDLYRLGVAPSAVHYVPTPVWDLNLASVRPIDDLEAIPTIAFIGRISREKGLDVLVSAIGKLRTVAQLWVLGAATDEDQDELTSGLPPDVRARIHFLGAKYRDNLFDVVTRAHCVVVPSLWPDNSPNVVIEALALGKPVVASDIGGIPDQLSADCGMLVQPGDSDGLAQALDDVLGNPERRAAMARHARERAVAEFSPSVHLARLMDILYQATASPLVDAVV